MKKKFIERAIGRYFFIRIATHNLITGVRTQNSII